VLGTAFSPDNQLVAVASAQAIALVSTTNWQVVTEIRKNAPLRSDLFLAPVAFSPSGHRLAYSTSDGEIRAFDLSSGMDIAIGRSARGEALTLCFTRDGRFLVSGDRERISVWDLVHPGQVKHLTGHAEQVVRVALSPDGSLLASASGDQTLKLWNTATWEVLATLRGHEHEVHGVAFSPDGKRLVSSGKDETIRIWNVPTTPPDTDRFGLSQSGQVLPRGPNAGRLMDFDWAEGRATTIDVLKRESTSQVIPLVFKSRTCMSLSADASMAAVGLDDGSVELWQTKPFRQSRILSGTRAKSVASAWTQIRHELAIARTDGTTELWSLDSNRMVDQFESLPTPPGVRVASYYRAMDFWSRDSILTRVNPATDRLPDMIDVLFLADKEHRQIFPRHKGYLNNFTISPDGQLLATSAWDGTVKLWDLNTGRELETFRGQLVAFTSVAFSPDGTRLVAGAWDGSVTLWDIATRQQVANWKAHERLCFVDFADSGRALLTTGERVGTPRYQMALWRAPTFAEIALSGNR
jgi:WD40 repeat protein